jgi:hypothetical protein
MSITRASLAIALGLSLAPMGDSAFAQDQKTEAAQPLTLSQKLAVLIYRTENMVSGREKMIKAIAEVDSPLRAQVCKSTSVAIPADVVARMNQHATELQARQSELTEEERASLAAVLPKLATLVPGKPFC